MKKMNLLLELGSVWRYFLFVFTVAAVPPTTVHRTTGCSKGNYTEVHSAYTEGRHTFIIKAEIEA